MKWVIEMDSKQPLLRVTTSGSFCIEDHKVLVAEILGHPEWKPGMDSFFDHRELDLSSADLEMMVEAALIHEEHNEEIGSGRVAVLMRDVIATSFVTMFKTKSNGKILSNLQAFTNYAKAEEWITSSLP